MNTPVVSVSMITYNHAPYIGKAIEGALHQKTDFPFEIVIGEDCSTDGTREIVHTYSEKHPDTIRVLYSETNLGAIRNYYRTDKACSGKYVAWCEGDDYWHDPFKLQKQVDYMETHPYCGLIHSDYHRFIVSSGETICNFNKKMSNVPKDNLDAASILRGGKYLYILTCTAMTRRDLYFPILDADPILYQSGRFNISDTSVWVELANRSGTHYIDESLATYTVLPNSASKFTDPVRQMEFGKNISELFLYLVKKYDLPDSEYDFHKKRWCQYAMLLAFYRNNKHLAREVIINKKYLSPKEYILYCGVTSDLLNRLLKKIIYIKNNIMFDRVEACL